MPEIADVVSATTIETSWGNAIRDRTIQRYASIAARDSLHPSPDQGDFAFVESTSYLFYYTGSAWRRVITIEPDGSEVDLDVALDINAGLNVGGVLNMETNRIANVGDPTGDDGAMPRSYADARYLLLTGGQTIAGALGIDGIVTIGGSGQRVVFTSQGGWQLRTNASNEFLVQDGGGDNALVLATNGAVSLPNAGTTTNSSLPAWRQLSSGDRSLNALVSSARYKRSIRPAPVGELVAELRAVDLVEWQERGSPKGSPWIRGVTAEQIAEIPGLAPLVGRDDEGAPLGFDPVSGLAMHLVAAVQYLLAKEDQNETD